ncbi:MAG: FHA domain-containing protein [Deltaproteobacteria bacterium]|nr:FHA domain-containing protein [Deltaproteobacteria bacterium]
MDSQLLKMLVCPRCREPLAFKEELGLICRKCRRAYPIRNGIPVLLEEEAYPLNQGGKEVSGENRRLAVFKVIEGKNIGEVIKLPLGTCKAIGRSLDDLNKTQVFNVDFTMSLDDFTKKLILNYASQQSGEKASDKASSEDKASSAQNLGSFKRLPDLVLNDPAISRLHAMLFHDTKGAGVLDLVSKNGTFVNGEEVESRNLNPGDKLEVGSSKFEFSYQNA